MKSFARFIIVLMTLMVTSINSLSAAVAYPVQLNAQILPPFTNCLGDYVAGDLCRIKVTGLLRDLTKTQGYDVGISVKVMQGSQLRFSSITNHVERLNPNEIHQFKLNDLFAETNLNAQYNSDGYCLKEGGYEFIFQAFDKGNAKLPLSEPVHFYAYLSQSEPPRLISPADGECVNYQSAAVNFVWMESTIGSFNPNKSFRIEVFEIPENAENFDQQALINSNVTKFTIENIPGNINFESFANTAGRLVKGRTYLWRVQTYDKTEQVSDKKNIYSSSSQYANGGYSKVYSFKYANCLPFEMKKDSVDNTKKPEITRIDSTETSSTIEWKNEPDKFPCGYIVAYNKAGDTLSNWAKVEVGADASSYTFKNIAPGVRYITHIIGICECTEGEEGSEGDKVLSAASDDSTFTLPKPAEKECHSNIDALTSQKSAETLEKGNYITANGQNVKLVDIERIITEKGDTVFSGKGVSYCPLLENKLGISVKFDSIKINENYEVMVGKVYAPTDLTNAAFLDADGLVNEGYTGTGAAPLQDAKYTTYGSKEEIPVGKIGVVDGVLYSKNADGTFTKLGTLDANGKLECEPQENGVDYKQGEVVFSPESYWNPPFDYNKEPFKDASIEDYYMNLNMGMSKRYDVPWIAMEDGKATTIKARFNDVQSDVVDADIVFACQTKDEMVILESTYDESKKEHTVTIYGGEAEKSLNIYAIYAGNGKCYTLGRARIQNMPSIEQALVLVPVGRTKESVDKEGIETYLNQIYGKLGVKYNVTVDEEFGKEEDGDFSFMADGLAVTGTGFMTTETDDMKQLKKLYKQKREIKSDAAYIFILKKAKTDDGSEVAGDMPRSHQVGYVFSENAKYSDGKTIAHELGHGLYSFEHTFENKGAKQGSTDNLMDYNDGVADKMLKVWQWNLLYTHKSYTVPFLEDDEDAMYKPWSYTDGLMIESLSEINDNAEEKDRRKCFTFSSPNGRNYINLPAGAKNVRFYDGYVVSFVVNNELWEALEYKDSHDFIGYFKDAKKKSDNSFNIDNSKTYKFYTVMDGCPTESDSVYIPISTDNCNVDLYKIKYSNDPYVDQTTKIKDAYKLVKKHARDEAQIEGKLIAKLNQKWFSINCLPESVRRLYMFLTNYYNCENSEEAKLEILKLMYLLDDVKIVGVDNEIPNDASYKDLKLSSKTDCSSREDFLNELININQSILNDINKDESLDEYKFDLEDLYHMRSWTYSVKIVMDNNSVIKDYYLTPESKGCDKDEWEKSISDLDLLMKNSIQAGDKWISKDLDQFVDDINSLCDNWLATISYKKIEYYIDNLVDQCFKHNILHVSEKPENALLKLIKAINPNDYENFIAYLSKDKNKMLWTLVNQMDDNSINPFNNNNYKRFIQQLVTMMKVNPNAFFGSLNINEWGIAGRIVDLKDESFWNGTSYHIKIEKNTGNLTFWKHFKCGTIAYRNTVQVIYEDEIVGGLENVSPFTPIYFAVSAKDPDLVTDVAQAYGDTRYLACPLLFLKFRDDKIFDENVKAIFEFAFDVLSIYSGVGTVLNAAKVFNKAKGMAKVITTARIVASGIEVGGASFDVTFNKLLNVDLLLTDVLGIASESLTVPDAPLDQWVKGWRYENEKVSFKSNLANFLGAVWHIAYVDCQNLIHDSKLEKKQIGELVLKMESIKEKMKKLGVKMPVSYLERDIYLSSYFSENIKMDQFINYYKEQKCKELQNDPVDILPMTKSYIFLSSKEFEEMTDDNYSHKVLLKKRDMYLSSSEDDNFLKFSSLSDDEIIINDMRPGLLLKILHFNQLKDEDNKFSDIENNGYAILSFNIPYGFDTSKMKKVSIDYNQPFYFVPHYTIEDLNFRSLYQGEGTRLKKYDKFGNLVLDYYMDTDEYGNYVWKKME